MGDRFLIEPSGGRHWPVLAYAQRWGRWAEEGVGRWVCAEGSVGIDGTALRPNRCGCLLEHSCRRGLPGWRRPQRRHGARRQRARLDDLGGRDCASWPQMWSRGTGCGANSFSLPVVACLIRSMTGVTVARSRR